MKITAISDLHGKLDFDIEECDLLLIAGDMCPATSIPPDSSIERSLSINHNIILQSNWLEEKFKPWLYSQPIEYAISVAGNHDWIWELSPKSVPSWFPLNVVDREIMTNAKIECIEDNLVFYKGLKIYGTPVQPAFLDWAFNRTENQLKKYWDAIPEGIDILLLHSPPYGILDKTGVTYNSCNIGSEGLLKRIKEVRPKLVVFGHNHGEHGVIEQDGIKYVNASLLNERCKMDRNPVRIDL